MFLCVLVYCRCSALLKTRKVDSIQDGYEMLTNHQDMFKKLPLMANLLNNFEFALRKSASLPTRLVNLLEVFDRESQQKRQRKIGMVPNDCAYAQ